ncbi:hypothetical protein GCE86_19660 [Micromonospora terminaliae]|uniref:Uncharacterized protein n=1 Tax=Micromonospora terminaliae TaxID=1914461 RepID=A0AAJ3DJT5_9ACTN|nr:hypothetical protein [Micromonospora terminaliae]NES28951.1 hypothetical protein [Micromonospora terminaliae]QGL49030.1 hypothetical protein GCE86_19660 [Micromonospora terminaliae]
MTDEYREYVRKLFGDPAPEPDPEPAEPNRGNHVPREGSTPDNKPTGDEATRQWVRDLFDHSGVPGW